MPGRKTSVGRVLVAGAFPVLLFAAASSAWFPHGTGPSHRPDRSNIPHLLGVAAPVSAASIRPASPAVDSLRSMRTHDGFSLSGTRGVSTGPIGRFLEAVRPLPWPGISAPAVL